MPCLALPLPSSLTRNMLPDKSEAIYLSLARSTICITRVRPSVDDELLRNIFHSFIFPILNLSNLFVLNTEPCFLSPVLFCQASGHTYRQADHLRTWLSSCSSIGFLRRNSGQVLKYVCARTYVLFKTPLYSRIQFTTIINVACQARISALLYYT